MTQYCAVGQPVEFSEEFRRLLFVGPPEVSEPDPITEVLWRVNQGGTTVFGPFQLEPEEGTVSLFDFTWAPADAGDYLVLLTGIDSSGDPVEVSWEVIVTAQPAMWASIEKVKDITGVTVTPRQLRTAQKDVNDYPGVSVYPRDRDRIVTTPEGGVSQTGLDLVDLMEEAHAWQAAGLATLDEQLQFADVDAMGSAGWEQPSDAEAITGGTRMHLVARHRLRSALPKMRSVMGRNGVAAPTLQQGPSFVKPPLSALADGVNEEVDPARPGLRPDWRGRLFGATIQ